MAVSTIKSGTELYMSLYPEESTDKGLRLGNVVPDFKAETTQGPMESFHEWKKGKYAAALAAARRWRAGGACALSVPSTASLQVGHPLLSPGRLHACVHD